MARICARLASFTSKCCGPEDFAAQIGFQEGRRFRLKQCRMNSEPAVGLRRSTFRQSIWIRLPTCGVQSPIHRKRRCLLSADGMAATFSPIATASQRTVSASGPCCRKTIPGLVQNCPPPECERRVQSGRDCIAPLAHRPGKMKTGFVLPISAKKGIGSGRDAAMSINALPATVEPVKPPAFTNGCFTSSVPTCVPASNRSENTPSGNPHSRMLFSIARPMSSLVPGCAGCAFTITGFPAASADAVSPPAVENASGKLLAPKTTTGPRGRSMERMSGFGRGFRSGSA